MISDLCICNVMEMALPRPITSCFSVDRENWSSRFREAIDQGTHPQKKEFAESYRPTDEMSTILGMAKVLYVLIECANIVVLSV